MSKRKQTKLVRENDFIAEVPVELIESADAWAPYLSVEDARKLDEVRTALRRGDLAAAQKHGRVYRLTPVLAG
jgi:predicted transcriptional regulator of viral defense system